MKNIKMKQTTTNYVIASNKELHCIQILDRTDERTFKNNENGP